MPNLDDSDWEMLLDRIRTGKCTPFLGAGVNYGFLPTGGAIASRWALQHGYPLADAEDLARVAQFVAINKRDPMYPKDKILREFRENAKPQDFAAADNPLGILAELPLPIYITTNYDNCLYEALKLKGKKPRLELCRWNSSLEGTPSVFSAESGFIPTKEEPVIFHLHGHQDIAESLVLTEDDYLEFLVNLSKKKELLAPRIQEALASTSLLFIGYRMADWDFRVLLHGILTATTKSLRRLSISVQLAPEFQDEDKCSKAQCYLESYFGEIQVRVYWGTARAFAGKLGELWHGTRAATVGG
jgi:hypothetical protein